MPPSPRGDHARDVQPQVKPGVRFAKVGKLGHFIDAGDRTAGGILHAVTSTAQTVPDADDAYTLERHALRAMAIAATYQR